MTSPVRRASSRSLPAFRASTPAQRPAVAPSVRVLSGQSEFSASRPRLQQLLRDNPGLRTNQDLINHFYRAGGNTWDGAQAVAGRFDSDLNELVKDRSGLASEYAGPPEATPPAAPPAPEAPPAPPAGTGAP